MSTRAPPERHDGLIEASGGRESHPRFWVRDRALRYRLRGRRSVVFAAYHANTAADCDIARGGEWSVVTSPVRRAIALQELQRLGVDAQACGSLIDASGAVREEAALPAGVFVPPLRFLSR